MALKIGTIEYTKGDESFEIDDIKIISRELHTETGVHKDPDDVIETVKFEVETEHGTITARRSGFDSNFECEDIEITIDNNDSSIEVSAPNCTIELDEDEY